MHSLKASLILLVAAAQLVVSPAASAAKLSDFDAGRNLYTRGDFQGAAVVLQAAALQAPDNGPVHYWLANAFTRTLQGDKAVKEYNTCLRLNPETTMANYCKQALAAYGWPQAAKLSSTTSSVAQTARAPEIWYGDRTVSSSGQIAANVLPALQARQEETLITVAADALRNAAALRAEGNRQASDMEHQTTQIVDLNTGDTVSVPLYSQEEIEAVRQQYERRARDVEDAAQLEARAIQQQELTP